MGQRLKRTMLWSVAEWLKNHSCTVFITKSDCCGRSQHWLLLAAEQGSVLPVCMYVHTSMPMCAVACCYVFGMCMLIQNRKRINARSKWTYQGLCEMSKFKHGHLYLKLVTPFFFAYMMFVYAQFTCASICKSHVHTHSWLTAACFSMYSHY